HDGARRLAPVRSRPAFVAGGGKAHGEEIGGDPEIEDWRRWGRDATQRPILLALALLSFAAATFASPIALVLPFVILLVDLFRSSSLSTASRHFGLEWGLYAAAAIPSLLAQLALA